MATAIFPMSHQLHNIKNKNHNEDNMIHLNNNNSLNDMEFLLSDIKNEYNNIYLENPDGYRKLKGVKETEKVYFLSEQYNINNINKDRALINTRSTFQTIQNNLSVQNPTDSLNDLFDNVKQSIIAGKNDYLDVLKDIFSKYMEYVRELREILSELGKSTKAGSKDGYINVNLDDLVNKLAILKMKIDSSKFFSLWMYFYKENDGRYYRVINNEKIYYPNNHEVDNSAMALEKLLNQIKGIKSKKNDNSATVRPDISFLFDVSLDLSGLDKLMDYLNNIPVGGNDMLQTEFDLLKKTLDSFEKGINTNLDELSKKYSAANSNYDNFVKIVSSTMNTLLEMAKGFLHF
ncbi:IpaD/SipD/SspD family type III secretion system needle tip protein [Proteus sp. G2615]|uniref:IpaD/SipD/SspD family type III secretion system needle tip protein n=1 Tax=Proteus sp. G2615 TaxID=2698845 RepID=UPI001379013B|nr:IpaD/SipD/SspD family type III secretion system needle tip protein [Proteus sp. G2615]NBN74093.1 IpaD/SipD/SspD family type III secretion system needle tip protein [Proteus sp. G2615]